MWVIDPTKLQKLLVIQDASVRGLAKAVGYNSHTHMARIVNGECRTVTPERAARIARFFGVGIDDLFVTRLSTDAGQNGKRKAAA